MMKRSLLAVAFAVALTMPALARDFSVPKKDPAIAISIPDNWKIRDIDYGFSAASPGDDVYFYVESTQAKSVDKMMALNDAWMKDQKITPEGEAKITSVDQGPVKATIYNYKAKDENGPTNVSFTLIPAGDRLIMLTLWGSLDEQKKHDAEIDSILGSIRPAK
ncbi:hypothetical protein SAMN05519103_07502 [Rhizobiales bacterium GAS113]|jgi:hypothetical protein|nr:hypothetical protein SAMN05519103_07502 [Rhizobiales bacterium GAS113]SED31450.1 hypothetical protein SAMN05519104_3287 [Rhizobiales bacterium GAS188]